MVNIIVTHQDGTQQNIEVESRLNLMEGLRAANVPGVVAECGGSMSCATCHVIVDANWLTATGETSDMENDMLECTATERETGSRLSCQIKLSEDLDGLRVLIPDDQF